MGARRSRDGAAATQHALAFPWALVLRPTAEVAAALAPYHGGGASGGGASDSAAFLRELEAGRLGAPCCGCESISLLHNCREYKQALHHCQFSVCVSVQSMRVSVCNRGAMQSMIWSFL